MTRERIELKICDLLSLINSGEENLYMNPTSKHDYAQIFASGTRFGQAARSEVPSGMVVAVWKGTTPPETEYIDPRLSQGRKVAMDGKEYVIGEVHISSDDIALLDESGFVLLYLLPNEEVEVIRN